VPRDQYRDRMTGLGMPGSDNRPTVATLRCKANGEIAEIPTIWGKAVWRPQALFLASNGVIHYPGQSAAGGTR
jgi:hypothetical protein